jgi:hypothetical protein
MELASMASAQNTAAPDESDDVSVLSMNSECRRSNDDLRGRDAHPQLRQILVRQMQRMYP